MIAIDSNVIISALNALERNHQRSQDALIQHLSQQDGWISPVVHAELRAGPNWPAVLHWLTEARVDVRWDIREAIWERAAEAYGQYVRLRRGGHFPRRILADFLIAAHAEQLGSSVMTYDDTVYRSVFPAVPVIVP